MDVWMNKYQVKEYDTDGYLNVWMWKFTMDNGKRDGWLMEKVGGHVIKKTKRRIGL